MLSNKMARQQRMSRTITEDKVIDARKYNLIMGAVVLYGLIANAITCVFADKIVVTFNPLIIIGYAVLAIIGCIISRKSNNALVSFIGYNLVCLPLGFVIAFAIYAYGGIESRPVQMIFIFTIGITFIMILLAILKPNWFAKLGAVLGIALLGVFIIGIVMFFVPTLRYIDSYILAVLLSLYIGYNFYRSQQFPKCVDNAADCALDIYWDLATIVNLHLALLRIFSREDNYDGNKELS